MRIVVVGCGSIGRRHLRNLKMLNAGELVGVDTDAERRELISRELAIPLYDSLEKALQNGADVVFVTVPTALHVPIALEAASADCHLFVEKPLSDRLENADRLVEIVRERKLITLVGCNMRFHPAPIQIKEMIHNGVIGQVIAARLHTGSYLPDWRPHTDYRQSYSASPEDGGGAILDCIHEIDLALWFFGAGKVVCAVTIPAYSLGLQVEGLAEILIQHQRGVLSSVHLNFVQRDYRRGCQIIGTEGTLYWDFEEGRVRHYKASGEWEILDQPVGWDVNQMYLDELAYFFRCVKDQALTFNDVEQGVVALRAALAAKKQAKHAVK